MTSDTDESPFAAKLEFSDAIIRVWGSLFPQVHAMIMTACRENAEARGDDAFTASLKLDLAIDQLGRDPNNDALVGERLALVDAVLRTWFRFPAPCTQKIFASVKELAILRDENPSEAMAVAYSVLEHTRSFTSVSEEVRERLAEQQAAQRKESEQRANAGIKRKFESETLRAR